MRLAVALVVLGTVATAAADVPRGAWTPPPGASTEIAGARVTIAADRGLVGSGDRVRVTLSASAPVTAHVIVLRFLSAGEDHGSYRVVADERHVARPAPSTTTFALGAGAPRGELQHYRIMVAADGERVGGKYTIHVGRDVATVPVAVWTGDTLGIELLAPASVAPTGSFTVTARIRNPTSRPIAPQVQLGTTLDGTGDLVDVMLDDEVPIPARATRSYRFTVTPRNRLADSITLVASALVWQPGAREDDEPTLIDGALVVRALPVK